MITFQIKHKIIAHKFWPYFDMFVFYDWPFPHVCFAQNLANTIFTFNSWLSFQRVGRLSWGLALSLQQKRCASLRCATETAGGGWTDGRTAGKQSGRRRRRQAKVRSKVTGQASERVDGSCRGSADDQRHALSRPYINVSATTPLYYSAPIGERSIMMGVSVCLCAGVCLSAITSSELHVRSSTKSFCACYLWPWLGPPVLCTSSFTDDVIFAHNPRLRHISTSGLGPVISSYCCSTSSPSWNAVRMQPWAWL